MTNWLDAEQAAKYLGIGISNLYSLANEAKIPGSKIGKIWKFNKTDLDTWIRASKPLKEFFTTVQTNIQGNIFLRDPQVEAYNALENYYSTSKDRFSIVQLPVGCGKSGLISILPFGLAKGRVLVIAPNLTIRNELEKVLDITNKRFCFWNKTNVLSQETMTAGPYLAVLDGPNANIHDCDRSHIVLTNIQQLASCADKWLPKFSDDYFDLILVDEGHHSAAKSWEKVFEKFENAKVINLTATPFRSDNKDLRGELVYKYSFMRAMQKGYIKRLQASYITPEELYFTYLGDSKKHTLNEVLQLKEEDWFSKGVALSQECNKHIVDMSLDKLEKLRMSGTKHQLIAVACSVNHAKAIRSLYAERGYEAMEIYSQMPQEKQTQVIQKLKSGLIDCIIQVQMLGEGFDHPPLSVAAIFRPFRSLPPYVQFVGRILRVVVQNDPSHPDNHGFVVTHIGMNLDTILDDFREIEREDKKYFNALLSGADPMLPLGVLEGDARMKLTEDMVVHKEIVTSFLEESFMDTDNVLLINELKKQAELMGFDADAIEAAIKSKKTTENQSIKAPAPFPIIPQKERRELRKRLQEEANRTAKLLLNRIELPLGGRELPYKYAPGFVGNNFTAAVQLVNKEIDKKLGIESGQRGTLTSDQFRLAIDSLNDILNQLTKNLIMRIKQNEQER